MEHRVKQSVGMNRESSSFGKNYNPEADLLKAHYFKKFYYPVKDIDNKNV